MSFVEGSNVGPPASGSYFDELGQERLGFWGLAGTVGGAQVIRAVFSARSMARALYGLASSLAASIVPNAAKRAADRILETSNTLVPYDTGALMRSGRVVRGSRRGQWIVEYTEDYAEIQHENLEFRHDYPRQAKYLATAMRREASFITGQVGQDLQGAFSSGLGGGNVAGRVQGFAGPSFVS